MARAVCPELPADAAPIAGSKTAWAISDPQLQGIRLLFADHARECRDLDRGANRTPMDSCATSWQFAFTLPTDAQKPGVYNLHDYEADYAEEVTIAYPSKGCSSGECMGGGTGAAGGAKGPESTVEIYSVSDECITGRIHRLERGVISGDDFDFTGAFQAVVCTPGSR